jgi:hypothetical protein
VGTEAFESVIEVVVPAFNRRWQGRLPEIVVPESSLQGS